MFPVTVHRTMELYTLPGLNVKADTFAEIPVSWRETTRSEEEGASVTRAERTKDRPGNNAVGGNPVREISTEKKARKQEKMVSPKISDEQSPLSSLLMEIALLEKVGLKVEFWK